MGRPNVLQLTIVLASICCTRVIISSPVPLPFPDPDPAMPLVQGGISQQQQDQQSPIPASGEAENDWSSKETSTRTAGINGHSNGRARTGHRYRGQAQMNLADLYLQSQGQGQILNRAYPFNLTGESPGIGSSQSHSHHHHQHYHHLHHVIGSSGSGISSPTSGYQASDEHVAAWREVRKRSGHGAFRSDRNFSGLRTNTIQKRNSNSTKVQIVNGNGLGTGSDTSNSNHTTVRSSSPSSSMSSSFNSTSVSAAGISNSITNSTLNPRIRNENETCTLEPAFLCLMDLDQFQRDKDRRLFAIKEYVMAQLGFTTRNPSKPAPSVDKTFIQQFNPSSPFSGQLQTLYASCDIPSAVDEETWNSPDNFNLYFNIPSSMLAPIEANVNIVPSATTASTVVDDSSENLRSFQAMLRASSNMNGPRPTGPPAGDISESIAASIGQLQQQRQQLHQQQQQQQQQQASLTNKNSGITSNVISAKLKLYKIGRGEKAENPKFVEPFKPSEPCNKTTIETVSATGSASASISADPIAEIIAGRNTPQNPTTEEKIRVSVYWYTVPVKKHHYKKKLLDTKMISVKESKWVEFDIRNAAILDAWLERRENNGLVVQVENDDNDWIDARYYFAGLSCTSDKSDQINDTNSTVSNTNETSASIAQQNLSEPSVEILPPPILEICTLSIPSAPVITTTLPLLPKPTKNRIVGTDHILRSHHQNQNQSHRHGHKHRHNHGDREAIRRHKHNNSNRQQIPQEIQSSILPSSSTPVDAEMTNVNLSATATALPPQTLGSNANTERALENRNQSTYNKTGEEKFSLDEDHPLRDILATVASSHGSSTESRQRKGQNFAAFVSKMQHQPTSTAATEQRRLELDYYNDDDDYDDTSDATSVDGTVSVNTNRNQSNDDGQDEEGGHDVIIQKIYISPPVIQETSSNSRSRRHHRPSHSQSQLQTDFAQVGII